jgi:hypothetical protein
MKLRIPPLFLSKKWTAGFMISHILGWTLANIQTIWIIWEIRKNYKILKNLKDKI